MGLYILIFELFIIIFYGIFIRTGSATTSSYSDLESPLYFILAFTLLNFRQRMYDWSQLTNLLFVAAIAFQLNTLYFIFWESAFQQNFNSTTNVSSVHLIVNVECTLAILVTLFQFTGRLTTPQVFVLCMVEVFAFALNFAINQLGLKAITAGGTMTIFLFGYMFAVPIRRFCCNEDVENSEEQQERYFTLTFKLLGLVACIMLWPGFSYTTAIVDEYYLTLLGSLSATASLSAEAFLQMIIGFCAAIGTTLGLRIMGEKIILDKFINTLLMAGIFLSSSSAVIIDPFASLLMGVLVPIICFAIERLLPNLLIKGYPVEGIIFTILGGIFDAIFTAGRNNRSPTLCNSPTQQGGFQFLSLLISAGMGGLFGLLAAGLLSCFNPRQSVNKDGSFWFIDQQSLPIYPDDPILRRIAGEGSNPLKQQAVLFNLKNAYITEKSKQNAEIGKIIKQVVQNSRLN